MCKGVPLLEISLLEESVSRFSQPHGTDAFSSNRARSDCFGVG